MDVFLIRDALKEACVRGSVRVVADGKAATAFFDQADADETNHVPP
jgi:hypothetical protein